ncbi:hypothetical protein DPMN_061553 [Dreissena polymorpha]|uniref:Uncharacterized protein n=1 Tax=Dreissena polymorpha TaxID=45954 RepID=A0A9D4C7T5_DREPO|nr:hypothetical protein DPMN_061553 [Dreissena polymorpha]
MLTNGYFVKPIFGSDLEKQIKVGTRVVRGRDWKWDEQVNFARWMTAFFMNHIVTS